MIVFETFLKVVNKCKAPILLYTAILIFFGGFNFKHNDNSISFVDSKPDIYIINNDEDKGVTKSLIKYISDNANIIELKNTDEAIKDALFYRDVNYIITIPENYHSDFMAHKNPYISIKSTNDYPASLAQNMLNRYLTAANLYLNLNLSEEELVKKINSTLEENVEVEITSKLDVDSLLQATSYYNFLNYCLLAGSIYVICLVINSFKNINIKKRTVISSMSNRKFNSLLLLSNALFAFVLWLLYVILSFILIGKPMFSMHGVVYIINSFIFSLCTLSIAFFLGNVVNNKEAINGIVNVIALGSSFLCGAFVPMDWLPDYVLKIAHVLPSYYFIKNNELVPRLEVFDIHNLQPIIMNMIIIMGFALFFVLITYSISKRKRKIG